MVFKINILKFIQPSSNSVYNCHNPRRICLIATLRFDLKVVSATFLLVYFLSLNKSTYLTRKNVFYFTSKALFVLEKIKF